MSITNQAKPVSSIANSAKVNIGETWAAIETTYATETRVWSEFASIISNSTKVSSSMTNIAKP
jgi:hypothetical protein